MVIPPHTQVFSWVGNVAFSPSSHCGVAFGVKTSYSVQMNHGSCTAPIPDYIHVGRFRDAMLYENEYILYENDMLNISMSGVL